MHTPASITCTPCRLPTPSTVYACVFGSHCDWKNHLSPYCVGWFDRRRSSRRGRPLPLLVEADQADVIRRAVAAGVRLEDESVQRDRGRQRIAPLRVEQLEDAPVRQPQRPRSPAHPPRERPTRTVESVMRIGQPHVWMDCPSLTSTRTSELPMPIPSRAGVRDDHRPRLRLGVGDELIDGHLDHGRQRNGLAQARAV